MKDILFGVVLASAFALSSAPSEEDLDPEIGGYVIKPNPSNGVIVIANAQKRIPEAAVKVASDVLTVRASVSVFTKTVDPKLADNPTSASAKKVGGNLVVFVKDDGRCADPLVLAPDSHWAVVNVAPLTADNPTDRTLSERVGKAVLRATCLICGGGASRISDSLIGPIKGIKDYDVFHFGSVPPDTYSMMENYLDSLGVHPIVRSTYYTACEEGWAPQPTNEIQKAIWEKVHAPPEKPMKITYDKDKQKPVVK